MSAKKAKAQNHDAHGEETPEKCIYLSSKIETYEGGCIFQGSLDGKSGRFVRPSLSHLKFRCFFLQPN